MNMLAKVIRNGGEGIASFRPDELGGHGLPSAGLQAFQFPAIGGGSAAVSVRSAAASEFTFPSIDRAQFTPVDPTIFEADEDETQQNDIEIAVREKALQDARADIEAELEAKTGALRNNLSETISRISGLAEEITAKMESDVVALALEIAKKVVAKEVSIDREVVLSVTKTALTKLHARTLASVHLHPDDLEFVRENREKLNFHGSLELIEDVSVTPGGCLIHTDSGDVDARIESQFDEIAHGLLGTIPD